MSLRHLALLAAVAVAPAAAQTYVVSNAPIEFPVNTPGATFTMTGIFPSPNFSAGGIQYGVCFYTGYGASGTPIVPTNETSIGNSNYSATVTVPASSFQVTAGFGTDGFNRNGKFYIAPASSTCTGDYNNSLTSENPLLIALPPTLTSVAAGSLEQPNTADRSAYVNVAPPHTLTFTGNYFYGNNNGGPATAVFHWTSSASSSGSNSTLAVPTQKSLVAYVPQLPADVASITVQVCNPVGTYTSCSASISVPLNTLVSSTGTVSSSASPATLGTQVTLSAEFTSAAPSYSPGGNGPMPAGTVTFTSDNTGTVTTIGTAPLVLDPATSVFVQGSSSPLTVNGVYPTLPTVATDLNKDGLADVVLYADAYTDPATKNVTPAQFTIILGNMPFGTFQAPQTLALPGNCASVTSYAFKDIDGDGNPDLVLACVPLSPTATDPYETYFSSGNGDGTFGNFIHIFGVTGSLLALADMNGDGCPDLVSQGPIYGQSNSNSYGFVVLQGDCGGDFYAPGSSGYPGATTTTGTSQPGSQLLVLDLNGDGYPDIVELHNQGTNGNTIDIYQSHYNGSSIYFGGSPKNGGIQPDTYIQLSGAPDTYASLFSGDLNLDGKPDLGAAQTYATSNSNPYSVDYAFNTSTASTISFGTLQSLGQANAPTFVAAADFTGDGYPDLMIGNVLYDNDKTGHFGRNTDLAYGTGTTPKVEAVTDLNGDSVADLIIGGSTYTTSGEAFQVIGLITSGSAVATLPYTFTTGTNANITAQWVGSAEIAQPTTVPTLSLPLTGSSGPSAPAYSITNSSPGSITVNSGDTSIIIVGTLPSFSPSTYGVCFYTGSGASSTVINPTNGEGRATFTAPASSIQQVPAGSFSGGTYNATVYVAAAGSTCTGTPDATVSNSYTIPIASNQATITGLQVPFVPALNMNLGGEGGAPPYPSVLIATGTNFIGTGATPNYYNSNPPLTQIQESLDGGGDNPIYGTIFNQGSLAGNPITYIAASDTVGIQACDNLGSPCSNTLTVPVHALETDNGSASYQVLQLTSVQFVIPASGTYQAANFFFDESATHFSNLTNVSPYAPQASGQYSVSGTGLYTFYPGDIASTVNLAYDATTTATAPLPTNPVALSVTFGTATPDVTGAPSGGVNFFDSDTYSSYYASLTLDPSATWVQGAGGFYSGIDQIALRPTIQDFNGDQITDMLVVDDGNVSGAPSLDLLAGSLPSGTYVAGPYFYVQNILPHCSTIVSYAVADFNNDGYPDVAILCTSTQSSSNTLSVILNNGDGTFNTTPLTWGGSINGTQIVTGDFDGDGNQDIAYAGVVGFNYSTQQNTIGFQVLKNPNGDGNFQLPDFYTRVPLAVGTQLAAADFDQDGYTDLAVLNGDPNNPNIAVYQNVGSKAGSIGSQFNSTPVTVSIPNATAVSNFNIVALQQYQPPSIVFPVTGTTAPGVYAARNTGTTGSSSAPGTVAFASTVVTSVANLTNAVFGDINGDGNLDAAIDNGGFISVLTGDGSGAFNGTAFTSLTLSDTNNTLLALADQNDDGYADLFTYTEPALQTYARPGRGVSARYTSQPTSNSNLHSYLTAGTATATTAPATFANGPHDFQVSTPGTVQIGPGNAATSFTVSSYSDGIAVTTSGSPSTFGQPVQITATLTTQPAATPGGNVTFYDGSNSIGTYALNSSVAMFAYSGLGYGAHNLTAYYAGNGTYPSATSPVFVQTVNQATPTITWATPAAITYGTALSAAQLNAIATDGNGNKVPGTFKYTPASGAVLGAGKQALSVTFTPTDAVDYAAVTVGNTIQINQLKPSLNWSPAQTTFAFGNGLTAGELDPVAGDGSGNTIPGNFSYTYTRTAPTDASGTATVGKVLPAGTYSITGTFTPQDTIDYASGTAITYSSFIVTKATPIISWTMPSAITYGTALSAAQLNANAKDSSGNTVLGVFNYTPGAGTTLSAGTQSLSVGFVPTDTADFNSVPVTTTSIVVNKATPVITWTTPAPIAYGTALSATQLNASAPITGVFNYTPGAGTTLNAGTQQLSVGFVPTDTVDYNAVPVTTTSLLVNKADPLLTYAPTPLTITYGTALAASQLNATSSDPTGSFVYTYTGTASGTASPGSILGVGTYALKATFTPTDTNYNPLSINGGTLSVAQATPVLSWNTPADIIAGVPLSATQLNATVGGSIPGSFSYTPTATTVLSAGTGQTLSVKFTPGDLIDYTTATRTTLINVIPLVISNVSPGTATLGDPAKLITLTGTGFLANSVVQANGIPLVTNYVNATTLTATVPASNFLTLSPIAITVLDPTQALSTNPFAITIAAAVPAVTFTGPSTMPPGQQPSLTYTLNNPYPVTLTDTITLSFTGTGGVDDPAIQFATGGRTLTFNIPAGSTVVPNLQFQDGTDAGTITATLTMTALGTNVTPTSATPITIVIPPAPPYIASATLTRSGNTLTVFIVGYSNTRDMTTAQFHFNAAPGASINDPDITVQAPALFTPWYSQTASQAYGSNFGYTQTFNLSTDAGSVGSVTVTLTNSVGNSITVTAQ